MHQSQWQSVSCCVSSVLYEWTGVDRCAACIQLRAETQVWASKNRKENTIFAQNNDQIEALKKTWDLIRFYLFNLSCLKMNPKLSWYDKCPVTKQKPIKSSQKGEAWKGSTVAEYTRQKPVSYCTVVYC